jgi:hypothetical protein
MRAEAKFHVEEAQKQLRMALKYASEFDSCSELTEITKTLNTLDKWLKPEKSKKPKKHELNNTQFTWNNEYKFVPALQNEKNVLTYGSTQ